MEIKTHGNDNIKGKLTSRGYFRFTEIFLVVLIIMTSILTGCGKGNNSASSGSASGGASATGTSSSIKPSASVTGTETVGNTPGNVVNAGFAAQSGDWIYFISCNINGTYDNTKDDIYTIGKIKADGSDKTTLLSENTQWGYGDLNIVGDWIYFISYSSPDNSEADRVVTINRMHMDGSGRTKLYSTKEGNGEGFIAYVNVVGDWIYSTELNYNGANPGESSINRVHTDGSSPSKLIVEENTATAGGFAYLTTNNGWLYYEKCGASAGNGKGLDTVNKIKMDGTAKTQLLAGSSSDESISFATAVGDWIYYATNNNMSSQSDIYKMHTDGSGNTKIIGKTDSESLFLDSVNASNDWIYYHSVAGSTNYLSKVRTDGTGSTHVATIGDGFTGCFDVCAAGDWIYYDISSSTKKINEINKVKTDGTGAQAVS